VLRPGDAAFLRNWEPGRVESKTQTSYSVIVLPVEGNPGLVSAAQDRDKVIRRSDSTLQLLRSHVRVLESKSHRRMTDELQKIARRGLLDLAALLLRVNREGAAKQSISHIRLAAARRFLEANYSNPTLGPADVATALGISVRALHRLFEQSDHSFAQTLLKLRLAAAHDAIACGNGNLRISEVALQCGFSDISSFNRCFRAHYGTSPSGARH
jgi:transcriptional regulator GlxA family with amidase domain